MKRLISLLTLALAIACNLSAATLTGTIKKPDGSTLTGRIRMTLSRPAHDTVSLTAVVPSPITFAVTAGALPGTAAVVGNDILEPSNTFYWTEFYNAAGMLVAEYAYYVSGASFDIGAARPTTITTSNVSYVSGAILNLGFGGANRLLGMTSAADAFEYKLLSGTTDQVTVTHGTGTITLSTPQSINTTSSPTFTGITITGTGTIGSAVMTTAKIGANGATVSGLSWNATATVADGGTITHGLGSAPTAVLCTPSTASEMCSVTTIGATTFTVAIKKYDNSAGTTQTIYWMALK